MRKIFILAVMMIFLSSCTYIVPASDGQKISPPATGDSPIYGQWIVSKELDLENSDTSSKPECKTLVNKSFTITNKHFVLEGYYWDDINFKTKLVSANDYFSSIGSKVPDLIPGKDSEIEVFTLNFRSKVLCNITIISKDSGILDVSGHIYEISKTSKDPGNINIEKLKPATSAELSGKTNLNSKTGVLLGLKTPGKKEGDETSYRTLWISKSSNEFNPIYEINTILFPRKTGFWTLNKSTMNHNNVKEDIFIPNDLSPKTKTSLSSRDDNKIVTEKTLNSYSDGYIKKDLTYICNDFISVDLTGTAVKNGETEVINKLHIYPVSSLPFEKSMSIEDIFKGKSAEIIRKEFSSAFDAIAGNDVAIKSYGEQGKNIGIVRRDSHWFFSGKINYTEGSELKTKNYDLSVLPPSNIVFYDNLFAPLNEIKKDYPFAKDAFSSPNNSLAILTSKDYLYVYSIIEEPYTAITLSKEPLAKIKLNEGEEVVMSEWAVGEHVKSWNDFVKSLDIAKIKRAR